MAPERLGPATVTSERSSHDEQQIGQSVQIGGQAATQAIAPVERPERSLGSPAHGTGQMTSRDRARTLRQNELLEWWQVRVQLVERRLDPPDSVRVDRLVVGHGQLRADFEQIVLYVGQCDAPAGLDIRLRKDQADDTIELVDIAAGGDAQVVLRHAFAVSESGRPVVSGPRVDLAEPMAHGRGLPMRRRQ